MCYHYTIPLNARAIIHAFYHLSRKNFPGFPLFPAGKICRGGRAVIVHQQIHAGAVALHPQLLIIALQEAFIDRVGDRLHRAFKACPVFVVRPQILPRNTFVKEGLYFAGWATEEGGEVTIRLTNVAAYEMNFDPAEITERFTRGDESRTTKGSGLGLAIAKTYTEAVGGNFHVEIDGDVFSGVIVLPEQVLVREL